MGQSPQIIEFVNFCEQIANGPYYYSQAGGRCDPLHSGYADCSGLVVAATNHIGVGLECTNSWGMAATAHARHTGISLAEARATRGALCIIGFDEGQSGGSSRLGHVAVSRGDGSVVEARNRRAGILYGPFDGRGWNYTCLPPWFPATVSGPTPPPTPAPTPPPVSLLKQERIVFIKPGHQPNKFRPITAAALDGAIFVFNTTSNPFHEGSVVKFGNGHIFALNIPPGATITGLSDQDEDGPLPPGRLVALALFPNGELARYDLTWR